MAGTTRNYHTTNYIGQRLSIGKARVRQIIADHGIEQRGVNKDGAPVYSQADVRDAIIRDGGFSGAGRPRQPRLTHGDNGRVIIDRTLCVDCDRFFRPHELSIRRLCKTCAAKHEHKQPGVWPKRRFFELAM